MMMERSGTYYVVLEFLGDRKGGTSFIPFAEFVHVTVK